MACEKSTAANARAALVAVVALALIGAVLIAHTASRSFSTALMSTRQVATMDKLQHEMSSEVKLKPAGFITDSNDFLYDMHFQVYRFADGRC